MPPPARSRNRVPTAVLFDTLSTPVAPSFEWPTKPNRTISGLHWAYILVGTADGTVLPFVPLYLFDRGLTAAWIGLVLAVAAAASLVLGLAWAYLADRRFSPERMVVAASVAASAVALLLALTSGALTLALVIVALSVARSPMMLLDPIALRRLLTTRRTDYARIRLRMSAGWAASAIGSGAVFQTLGLRLIPFVYAPLSALAGLWVWHALKPATESQPPESGSERDPSGRRATIPIGLAGFLVSCFLLGASLAATQNFLTLQINVLGGGAVLVGAAAAFQALTEIPTMGYTHVLRRYLSHRVLFAIGCGVYLVIFVAWAFASDALTAALLKLAAGVGFALTYVAAVMIANDVSPVRLRATGQALVKSVLFGLAPIAGTLSGGLLYGAFGPRVMFLASTAVVAAAGLIALFAIRGSGRRSEPRRRDQLALPAGGILLSEGSAHPGEHTK